MTESDSITVAPSGIEGLGLFAGRSFEAGERIHEIVMVREVTPNAPLRADRGERVAHRDYPDGKVVLIGFPSRHLNHSCDPNSIYGMRAQRAMWSLVAAWHPVKKSPLTTTSTFRAAPPGSPSNGFYEACGAERLYSDSGEFHGGYGWRDLDALVAKCGTDEAGCDA